MAYTGRCHFLNDVLFTGTTFPITPVSRALACTEEDTVSGLTNAVWGQVRTTVPELRSGTPWSSYYLSSTSELTPQSKLCHVSWKDAKCSISTQNRVSATCKKCFGNFPLPQSRTPGPWTSLRTASLMLLLAKFSTFSARSTPGTLFSRPRSGCAPPSLCRRYFTLFFFRSRSSVSHLAPSRLQ